MMKDHRHGSEELKNKRVQDTKKPPVILNMQDNDNGSGQVLEYLSDISHRGNVEIARDEAARLTPVFAAYSRRLSAMNALDNAIDSIDVGPPSLTEIFIDAAKGFKNTILSEVMIVPHKAIADDMQDCGFIDHNTYDIKSHYNGRKINFGFLQIFEKDEHGANLSSTGLPVLTLDKEYMALIKPFGGQGLLDDLQTVMGWSNHDMLHHYTSRVVTGKAARKITEGYESNVIDWYHHYVDTSTVYANPLDYERWAILSHMRTWQAMNDNEAPVHDVKNAIDSFLERLSDVAVSLKEQDELPDYKQHAIIDYFGMTMALAMSRLMDPGHDDFEHYFNRLKDIDPAPQMVPVDMLKGKGIAKALCQEIDREEGQQHEGYRFFIGMMQDSGLEREKLFKRSLFSLIENTGFDRDDLLEMDQEEFAGLWAEELEYLTDGIFEERICWDIRSFMSLAFDYGHMACQNQLREMAGRYLPLLIQEREDTLNVKINYGEGRYDYIKKYGSHEDKESKLLALDVNKYRAAYDYTALKKLQLAGLAPSIMYLHSEPQKGTRLEQANRQLNKQDYDMIRAVAKDLKMGR